MWPWGHLAVGYLCYSVGLRLTDRRAAGLGVVALAVGTQFPDLVDKPLAWTVNLLPAGRSLAHSLVVASGLTLGLLALSRYLDGRAHSRASDPAPTSSTTDRNGTGPLPQRRRLVTAFVLGYGTHLLGDALSPLVHSDVADLSFLLWPVLPPAPYSGPGTVVGHVAAIEVTPFLLAEFVLVGLALLTWNGDGRPGLAALRRTIRR